MVLNQNRAICDCTLKGVSVACRQIWPFWIRWSYFRFFRLVFERTPPREFIGSATQLVNTAKKWAASNAMLFVTVRWWACPWRAFKVGRFEFRAYFRFFRLVLERTPPREFIGSASQLVSTVMKWCWTKIVLFVIVRQRAWPWRAVKVGLLNSVVLFLLFSPCIWTNSS